MVLLLNILVAFLIVIYKDITLNKKPPIKQAVGNPTTDANKTVLILSILNIFLILISVYQYSGDILSGNFNKVSLLSQSSKLTEYAKIISTFILVYAFISKGAHINLIRLLSLVSIGYTFILGHRSFLVIAVIGILYYKFANSNKSMNLIGFINKYKIRVFFVLLFIAFVFFVKNVYAALLSGNYSLVFERLSSPSYYITALLTSEPNVITTNLNSVLLYDMKYDLWSYVASSSLVLFPFIGEKIALEYDIVPFSYLLQINFNKQINEGIGIGSTFIGEAFSTGGYGLVFVVTSIVCISLVKMNNWLMKSRNLLLNTWLLVSMVLLSFYINRNSMDYTLLTIRAYAYILLLSLFINFILNKIKKK
ncbi:hypothetical protein ACX1C1_06220 [Paenibacillus sp. strain BS8-2]